MANSIFIGNNFVWGIEYENKGTNVIKKYVEIPIEEGSIINGNILNMDEIAEKLTILKKDHGFETATLLLDTSEIQSATTLVPNLKKLEYQRIAENELNRENGKDQRVHYKISNDNRSGEGRVLFAATISSSIVDNYKELFSIAEIKLKAIKILEETVDAMYEAKTLVPEEDAIINILSSDVMYTAMYANGKRIFAQRTRLGLDTNGLEYELGNSLISLEQFNKAQRNPDPEKVYYLGLEEDVFEKLKSAAFIAAPVERLSLDAYVDEQFKGTKFTPVFMSIFDNKSLDLLKNVKTADELAEKTITSMQKATLGIVGLGAIGALIMGGVILFHSIELKSMKDYIENPVNISEHQDTNQVRDELTSLEEIIAQVKMTQEYIDGYNIVEIPLMEDIQLVAGSSARLLNISFDQINNIVSATLETKDASSASEYIKELKQMGFNVADINYTGYTESNPHIYLFTANIIPKNNKGIFEDAIDYNYVEEEPILQQDDLKNETVIPETTDSTDDRTKIPEITDEADDVTEDDNTNSVGGVENE